MLDVPDPLAEAVVRLVLAPPSQALRINIDAITADAALNTPKINTSPTG